MQADEMAAVNFARHLQHNSYPGRGFVVGRTSRNDAWLMVYWIMGRSAQSRNRRFVVLGSTLKTEPIDARLLADPSLIIYDAMLELPDIYLVGNGEQLRTLYDGLRTGGSFDTALASCQREPDAPHYTPRISAMLETQKPPGRLTLSILKANLANPENTDRITYRPALPPAGLGLGLTTYLGEGHPLPSFTGDPLLLPCQGPPEAVLDVYWDALNTDNRIAIAVKSIPVDGGASTIVVRSRFAA